MNRVFRIASTLLAVAATAIATAAMAQTTTAAGPYYATPSWDQTLPATTRLVLLSNFNNQAVLDRETGLVWLTFAQSEWTSGPLSLESPLDTCASASAGSRMGFRAPSASELTSLLDLSTALPWLPAGHPFQGLLSASGLAAGSQVGLWWTGTVETDTDGTRHRLVVFMGQGGGHPVIGRFVAGQFSNVTQVTLCVRGPSPSPQ